MYDLLVIPIILTDGYGENCLYAVMTFWNDLHTSNLKKVYTVSDFKNDPSDLFHFNLINKVNILPGIRVIMLGRKLEYTNITYRLQTLLF